MANDYICLNPECPPKQKQGFMMVYWQKPGRCKWCRHILKERAEYEKRISAWIDTQRPYENAARDWFIKYCSMRFYELTSTQPLQKDVRARIKKLIKKHKVYDLALLLGDSQDIVQKRLHKLIKDIG